VEQLFEHKIHLQRMDSVVINIQATIQNLSPIICSVIIIKLNIPPPNNIARSVDLILSNVKVWTVVLLNPNFSSITNVKYKEKGNLNNSLPKNIVPKKVKLINSRI
jgi:hypothetical protein